MASRRAKLCRRCRRIVSVGAITAAMAHYPGSRDWLGRAVAAASRLTRRQSVCGLAAGEAGSAAAGRGRPAADAWLAGTTVLVVGAAPDMTASLVAELERGGFVAFSASTVREAIAAIPARSVALLVVAGPTVTSTCLALRQATSLPILALLPSMSEKGVLDAFAAGADDCQSAIIGGNEVVLRVRAMLRRTRQAGRCS